MIKLISLKVGVLSDSDVLYDCSKFFLKTLSCIQDQNRIKNNNDKCGTLSF